MTTLVSRADLPRRRLTSPPNEESLTVSKSECIVWINIPRLTSWHQQLAVIWRLHEIATATRLPTTHVVLDVSGLDELPLPLMIVLSAIDQDLRRRGCTLRIAGACSQQAPSQEVIPCSRERDPALRSADGEKDPKTEVARKAARGQEHTWETLREEKGMSEELCVDDFGKRLLDHVEMLYRIALKFTLNPWDAEHITRNTLCQAWHCRERLDGSPHLKAELVKLLRQTFLSHFRDLGMHELLLSVRSAPPQVPREKRVDVRPREFSSLRGARLVAAL